jgi:hypothetical protein
MLSATNNKRKCEDESVSSNKKRASDLTQTLKVFAERTCEEQINYVATLHHENKLRDLLEFVVIITVCKDITSFKYDNVWKKIIELYEGSGEILKDIFFLSFKYANVNLIALMHDANYKATYDDILKTSSVLFRKDDYMCFEELLLLCPKAVLKSVKDDLLENAYKSHADDCIPVIRGI